MYFTFNWDFMSIGSVTEVGISRKHGVPVHLFACQVADVNSYKKKKQFFLVSY